MLIAGHAIADFWMQSDALAKMKNRHRATDPSPGQTPQAIWPYALTAHAIHHGAVVGYLTDSLQIGVAETAAHWLIDFGKCENWYGIHVDQVLHLLCKVGWCAVVVASA